MEVLLIKKAFLQMISLHAPVLQAVEITSQLPGTKIIAAPDACAGLAAEVDIDMTTLPHLPNNQWPQPHAPHSMSKACQGPAATCARHASRQSANTSQWSASSKSVVAHTEGTGNQAAAVKKTTSKAPPAKDTSCQAAAASREGACSQSITACTCPSTIETAAAEASPPGPYHNQAAEGIQVEEGAHSQQMAPRTYQTGVLGT